MSANLFKRYFWLMDVIYRSNGITHEEINRRWAVSELNERKENELPEQIIFLIFSKSPFITKKLNIFL